MIKYLSSFQQRNIISNNLKVLICLIFFRLCFPINSFYDLDLSSQTLNPLVTGYMATGSAVGDYFGRSVTTAGDINKDGYDDIIVGAYAKNNQQGAVYVIYGGEESSFFNIDLSTTTLDPLITGFMITGNTAYGRLGWSVSTAGDMNNDGYDDILVGAYGENTAYVIYGGEKSSMSNIALSFTTLNPTSTGFKITGDTASDQFGFSVSAAGDINNDGYDDIIIGAPNKNSNRGAAYVIYGGEKSTMANIVLSSTALNPASTGFTITGNAANDQLGFSVSAAGDLNNDGYDDIIIGAQGKNSHQGAAYVVYGGPRSAMSNIDLSSMVLNPLISGFTITGATAAEYFGISASPAGDVNHDGYDDIVIGARGKNNNQGAFYVIYASCSKNCKQCSSASVCIQCKAPYLLYQSECLDSCPFATFNFTDICKDCPTHCFYCTSQDSCIICSQGYTLSNSRCVLSSQGAQEKAYQGISSATQGIGSVICVGSAVFPLSALVSKIVQNTRYLNLSVTSELAGVYQTWRTDMISWDVPNLMSDLDHFETPPYLFAQYDVGSPFLVNFWPTLLNIGIGFGTFIACILLQKLFEHEKYEGWAYSLVQKLVAGSFNFAIIQAYACLDDILFYLVLDAKTNPFNSFFSWASMICAVIFFTLGCLLIFFNFWTVNKYQGIKSQGRKDLIDAFNERNKYWELFYSDFSDEDLWSQSFFALAILRSSLSSLIITILYDYPLMQTSYLVMLDLASISFLYFKTPFNTLRGKLAQSYYEIITLLVHICTFILSLQDTFKSSSEAVRLIMSTGILYFNTALVCGAIGFMFIEIYKTISQKIRTRRPKLYEDIAIQTANVDQALETSHQRKIETWINNEQSSSSNLFSEFNNNNAIISQSNMETQNLDQNPENSFVSGLHARNDMDRRRIIRPTSNLYPPLPRRLRQSQQKKRPARSNNEIFPARFVNE